MIIEGEEESGSAGFLQALRKYKDDIGHIDTILLSNSSWIGEDDPCVVFGLRGVIYANLSIASENNDAHSGVDGGAVAEPMLAMIRLLGSIGNENRVLIPGFYDDVAEVTEAERDYYRAVSSITGMDTENVMRKWRQPTFSVANIQSSGPSPANNTIIPKSVTANVSFRLVPNQVKADFLAQAACAYPVIPSDYRTDCKRHPGPLSKCVRVVLWRDDAERRSYSNAVDFRTHSAFALGKSHAQSRLVAGFRGKPIFCRPRESCGEDMGKQAAAYPRGRRKSITHDARIAADT